MEPGRSTTAELALIAIAAIWGLTFVMVQDAVAQVPTTTFLAYRFIVAAALVAFAFRRRLRSLGRDGTRAALVMGVFLTAGYVFQTLGLERTSAANAGFITGMFVVLTPLFGSLFMRHRAGRAAWAAAAVSALGLYLLTGGSGKLNLVGDGLVLLCACSFAFHILFTGKAADRYDVGALLAVQLAVAGVVPLLAAMVNGELMIPRTATVWAALGVTSLFASALGFFVQTYAQQHASPARTALILASEPAFAGFFAFVVDGERLTPVAWLGAVLIMVAIVTVELFPYLRTLRPLPEG